MDEDEKKNIIFLLYRITVATSQFADQPLNQAEIHDDLSGPLNTAIQHHLLGLTATGKTYHISGSLTGKTTTIRLVALRETTVFRHNGS